jgi:hypothetical protein
MTYRDLRDFVAGLESTGELVASASQSRRGSK